MTRRIAEFVLVVLVVAGFGLWMAPQDEVAPPVAVEPAPAATPMDQGTAEARVLDLPDRRASEPREVLYWQSLYDEAQAALGQGDNARAEARLKEALQVAPTAREEHETLDDLGLVCYRLGRYTDSVEYQSNAAAVAENLEGASPTVALYQSRLALALEASGEHARALETLRQAEATYAQAYADDAASLEYAREELAGIARAMGENELAAQMVGGP